MLRLENITIMAIILILFTYGISSLMMVYDDVKTLRTTIMDEAEEAEFSALFIIKFIINCLAIPCYQ